MIILDDITKSIEIVLDAVPIVQLPWTASYVDITTTTLAPLSSSGNTNGVTSVTAIASPVASTQRQVKFISVVNPNSLSATVTIRLNHSSNLRTIAKMSLASGDGLYYTDTDGFRVITTSGAIKNIIINTVLFTGAQNGTIIPGSFSGNPKKATVTLPSAYLDTLYSIATDAVTDGSKSYGISIESKTTTDFTVNLQSNNLAGLVEVNWQTQR